MQSKRTLTYLTKPLSLLLLIATVSFMSCNKEGTDVSRTIYVQRGKVKMPVYLRGNLDSKVMILIVHGGPGGNGYEYSHGKYADMLEKDYTMAYWDQRGQGMSVGKFDDNDLNIDEMTDDLKAVIQVMKHKFGDDLSLFVLGHSWGGTLGTAFMVKDDNQHMVKGWIEADGAHDIPKLNKDATLMFRRVAQEQIDAGNNTANWNDILSWANGIDTANISNDQGGEINSKGFKVEKYLTDDGILNKTDDSDGLGLWNSPINLLTSYITGIATSNSLNDEVESTSLTSSLNKITIPCLFLWGKYDFVVPPTLGEDAYNLVSSTEKKLVIFEKSGHSPMNNEPEAFANEVKEFVEKFK